MTFLRTLRPRLSHAFPALILLIALCLSAVSCGNLTPSDSGPGESSESGGQDMSVSPNPSESPAPDASGAESESTAERNVVFRMAVASDVHISSAYDASASRLKDLFSSAYAYAETQPHPALDAAVFVGDLTNYGRASEWKAFLSVSEKARKEETEQIAVMGNHEYYEGGKDVYRAEVSGETNLHEIVNGFHLIALSPDGDNLYSAETLNFLKTSLEEAAADDPDKPIFVFQHHHIRNTVYVSSEWYAADSAKLDAILRNYPQVIDFSGHSHAPVNHPESIFQKDYTCVGTGTLAYFELLSGMSYGTIPPNADQAAQYWIVEVTDRGVTTLRPYNLLTGDFFRTQSTKDGDETISYTVSAREGKDGFRYTREKRLEGRDVPQFPEQSELSVGGIDDAGADLVIPQAEDGDGIYS